MALFKVDEGRKMQEITCSSFEEIGDKERKDLQAMLRDNFTDVFKKYGLFLISEEYSNWQESLRSIDLLAIDREANLVVIELKRIAGGGHMELQALRYAAMVSMMNFNDVVTAHEVFLSKNTPPGEPQLNAREELVKFLGQLEDEITISETPKILLIAPSFSKEITTAVLWLNDNYKMGIKCLEIKPYQIGRDKIFDIEQVIPLPSAETFILKMREKNKKADEIIIAAKRRARTMTSLIDRGYLKANDRLYLLRAPRAGLNITDESARKATFIDDKSVKWDYDGKIYRSLTKLCEIISEKYGDDAGPLAFQGPDYWAKEGDKDSLWKIATALE